MDVVGTASAVLGILQVGFSLAKAIRETVKDYKDAADDLISLAQEIESTLYLVSQLDRLVVDNKKTGTFNDGGMAELNRCLKSTEQIVSALVELLTKTGVSHPSGTKVNPENLIISRPHRRKWLGQKSRVKEKQEELNKVRLEVTTIILLRDTLQADQSSNKAMQQALITAERDRRRKARARRRRQKGNPRVRQPGPNARKITTGMDPAHFATPPSARVDRNGDRGFESFAYRTEVSPPGPTGTETTKSTSSESNIADLNIDNDKTATEKQVKDEDTTRNTISDIIANHKTAKGGSTAADFDAYFTAHANVANPGSIMNVENVPSGLADGTSPMIHNSVHHNQPRFSSEVIIEEFKRQTKAEGMKLSEAYQAMMERATKHAGRDEPDHGLRRFLESEYAQEWADMFGDWLPGTRPELTTSPNAHKVEVKPSKLQRWSFPSLRDKQHKPKTEPQSLNLPRSAHLLVVERHAEKPDILRLNPPERFQRPDLRKTGLIWSNFEDGTKEAVWQTLRFEFMLPDAFQWVLHDAMMVDPGPSLLTRGLIRLLPRLEYKKVNKDSYIVVFVPTNSTQSRPDPFGQVDVADHGLSDGPPVPAGAIPGPYSPQNHRREDRTETAIPSQEHRYTPVYAGEPDAMYPRHYTTSPAFARPGPVPLADRVSLDQMPSERIPVNRMPADRMPVDRMPIDRMQDDRMQLDPMPSYRVSRRRHSTPPPNDANRGYQQRVPRPRNGYPPDRNGYPPFSEDPRPGAPRARKSARLPSDVHISKLQDSDPRRPAVSSAPTGLTRLASYRRLRGSNQPWSKSDSSGENSDVSSSAATTVSSFIPDSWACIRSTSMGARFLPSEATDSSDQSDDSLDDDELYDQLLRKFTGHGLRERESANGNTDGRLKGDDEEVSGNVSGNGNTNVNVGVDAENTDKITDGDADDRTIDRDDKSDPQNQDLYR